MLPQRPSKGSVYSSHFDGGTTGSWKGLSQGHRCRTVVAKMTRPAVTWFYLPRPPPLLASAPLQECSESEGRGKGVPMLRGILGNGTPRNDFGGCW